MNRIAIIGIAALSLNALIAGAVAVRGQQMTSTQSSSNRTIMTSTGTVAIGVAIGDPNGQVVWTPTPDGRVVSSFGTTMPPPPAGALHHQVVDVYYDADGQKLETHSYTHLVAYDCHNGLRRNEDLVAQDDGHGGVTFTPLLLPSEPAKAAPKPVSAEGRVRVMLAARGPAVEAAPAPPISLAEAK